MKKLYIASLLAVKEGPFGPCVVHSVAATHADSKQEAIAFFAGVLENEYPVKDGYKNHSVTTEVLPEATRIYLDLSA